MRGRVERVQHEDRLHRRDPRRVVVVAAAAAVVVAAAAAVVVVLASPAKLKREQLLPSLSTEYIEPRLDLSVFKSQPSEEYVTGCIAPFALSPEVTDTIPTDTLGTLITCDFTEVTDAFRSKWERDVAKAAEKGEDATKVSEAADDAEDVTDDAAAPSPAPM